MTDRLPHRLRTYANVRTGETRIATAARRALRALYTAIAAELAANGYNPDTLDTRDTRWTAHLTAPVLPEVTDQFRAALRRAAAAHLTIDATPYTHHHLETVTNRLTRVTDNIFDTIRDDLTEGWLNGDTIPELAARINTHLTEAQATLIPNRATVIARTEAVGANNAGAHAAADATAALLGVPPDAVVKEWLPTPGPRTRDTHAAMAGVTVTGLDTPFTVGAAYLQQPGDPTGPPEEVVQCRCSVLYLMPGDPGYPDAVVAAGHHPTNPTSASTLSASNPQSASTLWHPGNERVEKPMTAAAPEDAAPTEDTDSPARWRAVLAPEGVRTGDGRIFAEGAIEWMTTPGTLMAQFSTEPGHDGAVAVGRIETVTRRDGLLYAEGTWDDGENAAEARRQNISGLMRGVSVDLDNTTISLADAETGEPLTDEEAMERFMTDGVEPLVQVDAGRLRAATLCYIPAYVEAYVLDSSLPDTEAPDTTIATAGTEDTPSPLAIAASAAAPVDLDTLPTSEVFSYPDALLTTSTGDPAGLTVTPDGRVYGYLATWGTCHIGFAGQCITPPPSRTGYAHFLTGVYDTRDGRVPVGQITLNTGHAAIDLPARPAAAHYDDTGTAVAYVNVGEDGTGIWFAGVLDESVSLPDRQKLARAGAVSGDWRPIGGHHELVAALAVNVNGFPIPRTQARVAGGHVQALVAAGLVAHNQTPREWTVEGMEALAAAVASHIRAAARRESRASIARGRITATLDRAADERRTRFARAAARLTEGK